ncbi:MAG: DegT/DnrJ/EryC1/StrS family aminotransferase [Alphaproteobacteria bacterium]|nr:DegT/DnrJ/EryC1/StrS family aminotransferase [Alphaproteobacteria bacterium]
MDLALLGGEAVRRADWPAWPYACPETLRQVESVLRGTKWTLTGQSRSHARFDRDIRERWAEFVGTQFALPCSSGTAGLIMALEALDISLGDEVIVPGLTWVACPHAVCTVGATPILVDIDPATLCIDPQAIRQSITSRTKAILLVHAYCSVANLDDILAICQSAKLHLIEDCSQAHGAAWRRRRVGSFGDVAVFSTHQSKLLSSGEGGLCCTDDEELYSRLQQARTDGRVYESEVAPGNWMSVRRVGARQGRNFVMPEVSAALLVGGLRRLDEENERRSNNHTELGRRLDGIEGVSLVQSDSRVTQRSHWRLVLRIDTASFADLELAQIGNAITAELGLPVEPFDTPLHANALYQPLEMAPISRRPDSVDFAPDRFRLPNAELVSGTCLAAPHFALLGSESDIGDIARAVEKVQRHARTLSNHVSHRAIVPYGNT